MPYPRYHFATISTDISGTKIDQMRQPPQLLKRRTNGFFFTPHLIGMAGRHYNLEQAMNSAAKPVNAPISAAIAPTIVQIRVQLIGLCSAGFSDK